MRIGLWYLATAIGICAMFAVAGCSSGRTNVVDVEYETSYSLASIDDVMSGIEKLSAFPVDPSVLLMRTSRGKAKVGVFRTAMSGFQVTVWLCPELRDVSERLLIEGRKWGWDSETIDADVPCRFRVVFSQQGTTRDVKELVGSFLRDVLAVEFVEICTSCGSPGAQ